MERIVFADSWKSILAEYGLKSFRDFYKWRGGKYVNKNKKRNVLVLSLKIGNQEKIFYLKRFHHPYLKDILFTLMNCGTICSQAAYEWKNVNLLKKNSIETYRPVCFGEQLRFGIERKSFIITEELEEQCLTDFIAQNWTKLTQSEKEKIIISLAHKIRRIHKAGISLPDLLVRHIFISENKNISGNSEYNFAVIDLHRMKRNISENEKIKNLGRLHFSMIDKYFDKPMRKLLIESYAGDIPRREIDKLVRRVERYSAQVSAIKRQKPY
jgi:tRNA A-37 threonylcarbamoyl transferase component Bud32